MNREFKFRAWCKSFRKMYSWKKIQIACNWNMFKDGSDFEVMQYTGLADFKGVNIYEGDIVYIAGYGNYIVKYPYLELFEAQAEGDIGKIIGNIYENPELLKGGE